MTTLHRLSFKILVAFTLSFYCRATNYYIDNNGSDSNPGSSESLPWKTLAKVATFSSSPGFVPGDQILLRAGQAFEKFGALVFNNSGIPGAPIVFDRYGAGSKPKLYVGQKVLNGWTSTGGGVFKWQSLTSDAWHLWEDGIYRKQASDDSCTDGAWYHNTTTREVFWRPSSGDPLNHIARTTQNGGIGLSFVDLSYITVRNLHFPGVSTPLNFQARTGTARGITVESCDFEWTVTAINLYYPDQRLEDVVLRENTITHTLFATKFWCDGTAALAGRMVNVLVENNTIRDLDMDGRFDPAGTKDHEAIYIQCPINVTIRGNTVQDVRPTGSGGNGISVWIPSTQFGFDNVLIENNFLNNTDTGISVFGGATPDRALDAVVRNNISINNRRGMKLNTRCTIPGRLKAEHNIVHACQSGIVLEFRDGWEVKNNIISEALTGIAFFNGITTGLLHSINNNLYFSTGGAYSWTSWNGNVTWTMTTWRQLRDVHGENIDSTSIFTNPQFINASGQFDRPSDFNTAPSYHHWLQGYGLPMNATGNGAPSANPVADGLPNLIKYALGLSPWAAGDSGRISHGMTTFLGNDYLTLTYTRPDPSYADVVCFVEGSNSLASWDSAGFTEISNTLNAGLRTITVRDNTPVAGGNRRFIRLNVTKP